MEVELKGSSEIEIYMDCSMIKRKVDMEVWSSRVPSEGFTLKVNTPSGIKVNATANHFEQLQKRDGANGLVTWKLNYGIFPFQSVIFWWNVTSE